jgi:hypothetical protein
MYSRMFFDSDSGTTSGDATETSEGKAGKDSTSDANDGGTTVGKTTEFQPITSQEDFDAALAARLARHEAKVKKSITDQVKADLAAQAQAAKAKEDNDYKTLYEAEITKRETAERERDSERKAALRSRIAAKHSLPDELADVLKGDNEDELEDHAKRLAKVVKTKSAPDTEVGRSGAATSGNAASDRPKPKPTTTDTATAPVYTFDGKPKIPFPTNR